MDFIKELGYLAIASRMKRLTDGLLRGGSEAYRSLGLDFEPRWFTLFYFLHAEGSPLSIKEIADALKVSHPAVIQTAQMLAKKGLIRSSQDSKDKRKRRLALTPKGKELAVSLDPVWGGFGSAAAELFAGAGIDMLDAVQRVEAELDREEMGSRIIRKIKEMQAGAVEIVGFSPEHSEAFRKLNEEWLKSYFEVEEADRRVLLHPEKEILEPGGAVLFARLGGEIVGTAALLKLDKETYEIAKMAVTPKAQGRQVGRRLTEEAIATARRRGAKKVVLFTDDRLRAAASLYRKLGFEPAPSEATSSTRFGRARFGYTMRLRLK
ncbi:MAG: family N-acetyltransferase [Candidatus Aminicenantes bacterium]|jgi:DNA-binding MarR family transcriptional regulator/N-acetylglutamate synthase-like GNAT family acetyltransferase|nr:family N-acetyltransferase [Candidatus Aminicenantes bacterium]